MSALHEDDLHEDPEDLTKQTAILNQYCFWYHKRHQKIGVRAPTVLNRFSVFVIDCVTRAAGLCLRGEHHADRLLPNGAPAGSSQYAANLLTRSLFKIEHFWRVYDHMIRVNDVKSTTDFHLFKQGIKPTWEDPQNEKGGKWMIRLKKGLSSRYWEDIVLAIIGEQFDVGHEICGAVISVRAAEDILSVWNKNSDNLEAKNKIRSLLCSLQ